jgi:methylmalonyl-CoA mutase cobalamin-binding domain/chain
MSKGRTRVLIAKLGLDGHDRGALILCAALRDAGLEVIYSGLHQTPEAVADMVVQEDAQVVGVSSLADAHRTLVPKLVDELARRKCADVPMLVGGFIQPEDIPELKRKGVVKVFGVDSNLDEIVAYFRKGDFTP